MIHEHPIRTGWIFSGWRRTAGRHRWYGAKQCSLLPLAGAERCRQTSFAPCPTNSSRVRCGPMERRAYARRAGLKRSYTAPISCAAGGRGRRGPCLHYNSTDVEIDIFGLQAHVVALYSTRAIVAKALAHHPKSNRNINRDSQTMQCSIRWVSRFVWFLWGNQKQLC